MYKTNLDSLSFHFFNHRQWQKQRARRIKKISCCWTKADHNHPSPRMLWTEITNLISKANLFEQRKQRIPSYVAPHRRHTSSEAPTPLTPVKQKINNPHFTPRSTGKEHLAQRDLDAKHTIFVGNITPDTTQEDLIVLFTQFGMTQSSKFPLWLLIGQVRLKLSWWRRMTKIRIHKTTASSAFNTQSQCRGPWHILITWCSITLFCMSHCQTFSTETN